MERVNLALSLQRGDRPAQRLRINVAKDAAVAAAADTDAAEGAMKTPNKRAPKVEG